MSNPWGRLVVSDEGGYWVDLSLYEVGRSDRLARVSVRRTILAYYAQCLLLAANRQSGEAGAGKSYEDGRRDERAHCAQVIEGLALRIRDHGPRSPEGLLTPLAGAHMGALMDAATALLDMPPRGQEDAT